MSFEPTEFRKIVLKILQNRKMVEVKKDKKRQLESIRKLNANRLYSNNMSNAVNTTCKVCGDIVTAMRMRNHTKAKHSMGIKEYRKLHGDFYNHLLEPVFYHNCGLCHKDVLLDGDQISNHASQHRISLKEYNLKFMVHASGKKREKLL